MNDYSLAFGGEYYHSNGDKEANQFSNGGVWKQKDPQEIAQDIIDFYMLYAKL